MAIGVAAKTMSSPSCALIAMLDAQLFWVNSKVTAEDRDDRQDSQNAMRHACAFSKLPLLLHRRSRQWVPTTLVSFDIDSCSLHSWFRGRWNPYLVFLFCHLFQKSSLVTVKQTWGRCRSPDGEATARLWTNAMGQCWQAERAFLLDVIYIIGLSWNVKSMVFHASKFVSIMQSVITEVLYEKLCFLV